jgi:Zn-finger nucleic acid-binding protein
MRCPVDDAPFREVTRRGVKVDICSDCRGVWLDRGELDHLLEAASAADEELERAGPESVRERAPIVRTEARAEPRYEARAGRRDHDDDDDDDDRYREGRRSSSTGERPKSKRFSWLSEILEFGE